MRTAGQLFRKDIIRISPKFLLRRSKFKFGSNFKLCSLLTLIISRSNFDNLKKKMLNFAVSQFDDQLHMC